MKENQCNSYKLTVSTGIFIKNLGCNMIFTEKLSDQASCHSRLDFALENQQFGFQTRSDSKQPVQSQKQARSL